MRLAEPLFKQHGAALGFVRLCNDTQGRSFYSDITKPVTLTVDVTAFGEHPMAKKEAAGFAVSTVLKRSDYGMDMYVPYVGDEVTVTFHSEALKADATN